MARQDKLQAMCATPLEIESGGKTYRLKPLTLGQYAEMERWAKQQPFVEIEAKLAGVKDKKLRERLEGKLLERAIEQSESEQYVAETLNGAAAIEKLFGLMLSANHPGITAEEVRQVLDFNGLMQVRAWVEKLVAPDEDARKN